jgi:hypothetical protein
VHIERLDGIVRLGWSWSIIPDRNHVRRFGRLSQQGGKVFALKFGQRLSAKLHKRLLSVRISERRCLKMPSPELISSIYERQVSAAHEFAEAISSVVLETIGMRLVVVEVRIDGPIALLFLVNFGHSDDAFGGGGARIIRHAGSEVFIYNFQQELAELLPFNTDRLAFITAIAEIRIAHIKRMSFIRGVEAVNRKHNYRAYDE